MNVPISWLKDYVNINLDIKDLMWKMTEVGITTEFFEKVNGDLVLDAEITPNRPDWLSMVGIAREVAAIQGKKLKYPKMPTIPKKEADLSIDLNINHKLCKRYTAITVADVEVKHSPEWMQKKLKLIGLRPINNLVDITNYVMFELGVPIHVFDYDKLGDKKLKMRLSRGGEEFTSVDGISYELPKNAIIITEGKRVIDLCGIKGGKNTAIDENSKNIYIHVPVYTPELIRKTSQKLKLSSEASYIYERGANAGGTEDSLKRVVDLVLDSAGGKIASEIIDIKDKRYVPNRLVLHKQKLDNILGVEIPSRKIVKILKNLDFQIEARGDTIICLVPIFRGDVKIEEDIIEEVGRMYGYNELPHTMPSGKIKADIIPFYSNKEWEMKIKQILTASGYNESKTLSLISEETITNSLLSIQDHIKLANPVSNEYEFLRTTLIPSLLSAAKLNQPLENLRLFEYSKVFKGPLDSKKEKYSLAGIAVGINFSEAKGVLDFMFKKLGIEKINIKRSSSSKKLWHKNKSATIERRNRTIGRFGYINPKVLHNFGLTNDIFAFELDPKILKKLQHDIVFNPLPKYPPQVEDITVNIPNETNIGDVIRTINSVSKFIVNVQIFDKYQDAYTFRVNYQHPKKTLTDKQVERIRKRIVRDLKKKHKIII